LKNIQPLEAGDVELKGDLSVRQDVSASW